jgi:hypothetical protein
VNVRQVNSMLWATAVVMAAGAIGVLAWAVWSPVAVEGRVGSSRGAAPASAPVSGESIGPLAAFEPVWKLDLRKPLDGLIVATGARPAAATLPVNQGPPITLVGTIGDSVALVRLADGRVEVKAVGESAAGVRIVAVRPAQVDVEFGGQVLTLKKPKEPGGG